MTALCLMNETNDSSDEPKYARASRCFKSTEFKMWLEWPPMPLTRYWRAGSKFGNLHMKLKTQALMRKHQREHKPDQRNGKL